MDAVGAAVIIRESAVHLSLNVVQLQLRGALWWRKHRVITLTETSNRSLWVRLTRSDPWIQAAPLSDAIMRGHLCCRKLFSCSQALFSTG